MVNFNAVATSAVALAAFCGTAFAHPGEKHDSAKRRRDLRHSHLAARNAERAVVECKGSAAGLAMEKRASLRRAMKAAELREKRGIEDARMKVKRGQEELDAYMQTCHNQGDTVDWDKSTPHDTIFGGNATIGLAPETIIGPYWVGGEFVRPDIVGGEAGIPIHLDLQFLDVASCAPVPDMLVDVWHANALGNYSGVVAGAGLDTTFLRGVQVTDAEGVANFDSVFPGHYQGRVNHIHVTSNRGGTLLENGTYTGGTVNHIGQLYFDQELINAVEALAPYVTNTMRLTYNQQDFLAAQQAGADYDPFFDYVMLSEDPADGLLMWMTIGINGTADYNSMVSAGAMYYEGGGVDTSPKFNGTFPPFPTGSMPPGFPPLPTGEPAQFWGPCMKKKKRDAEDE